MKLSRYRLTSINRAGFHLPYVVDFSTLSVVPRWFRGSTWSIASGKLINIPQFTELVTNGGMEIDANWANFNGTPTINAQSQEQVHSGIYSRKVQPSTVNSGIRQNLIHPIGAWLRNKHWGYGTFNSDLDNTGGGTITSPGVWAEKIRTKLGTVNANTAIVFYKNDTNIFYVDDVSVASLIKQSCFCTVPTNLTDLDISASITLSEIGYDSISSLGGVFARMDNVTNPLNYLMAYYNGAVIYLDAVINGTRTNLTNSSITVGGAKTYNPGAPVRILVYGNYAQLKYDNSDVGPYVDISAVGGGKLCGLFSTDPSVQFNSMVIAL